jgi:ferredoxin
LIQVKVILRRAVYSYARRSAEKPAHGPKGVVTMAKRNIIHIDEEKCNGCGNCITGCAEGALALIDGKAKLVKERYCDGLGACIGECPTGALWIEERAAEAFDEEAVEAHMAAVQTAHAGAAACPSGVADGGCPGSASRTFAPKPVAADSDSTEVPSALTHWPVQLHLISPSAPQYQEADLLIAADCTAFALGAFHSELLNGRALAIACPKLDDRSGYVEKLSALFREARPAGVTAARMEVPCCGGLVQMVLEAREGAGSGIPVRVLVVSADGALVDKELH